MTFRLPDSAVFTFYALPLFFFPLSTAGAGISAGLFLLIYAASGYWRRWREIAQRSWALPLALLIVLTLLGLLWTENMHFGLKVSEATSYGVLGFMGATLPWQERWVRLLIRLFLGGLIINLVLAALMTWHILPWANADHIAYTGFADHIWLSLALAHALLWLLWDIRNGWNFGRWTNGALALLFFAQMLLTPGRSGQLLFILFMPIAAWVLYHGRWRYWALGAISLTVIVLAFMPAVQTHLAVGVRELLEFSIHQQEVETSWGIRLVAMIGGIMIFLQHPLFGVGTGDFYNAILALQAHHEIPATPGFIMNSAANSFISEMAVLGLPGLYLFLWFLWRLTTEAWRCRNTAVGWFAITYIAIFWVGGAFDSLSWGYGDAITIGLIAGLPLLRKSFT